MYNVSFIHVRCISWTYLHDQVEPTNERITVHDSFPSPFTAKTMLWTVIRSFAGCML